MNEEYLLLIDISNRPDFPTLTRKAGLTSYVHDHTSKLMVVNCNCIFFKDGQEYNGRGIKKFTRTLTADTITMCNPNSGVVCTSSQVNNGTEEEPLMETIWTDKLGNIVSSPVSLYAFYTNMLATTAVNIINLCGQVITAEDQIYNGFN